MKINELKIIEKELNLIEVQLNKFALSLDTPNELELIQEFNNNTKFSLTTFKVILNKVWILTIEVYLDIRCDIQLRIVEKHEDLSDIIYEKYNNFWEDLKYIFERVYNKD